MKTERENKDTIGRELQALRDKQKLGQREAEMFGLETKLKDIIKQFEGAN